MYYDLYGHTLGSTRTPVLWSHEIYYFGRPFLGHHYCLIHVCPGVEKILKGIYQFYTFYPKIISPYDGGWGLVTCVRFINFSSPDMPFRLTLDSQIMTMSIKEKSWY